MKHFSIFPLPTDKFTEPRNITLNTQETFRMK